MIPQKFSRLFMHYTAASPFEYHRSVFAPIIHRLLHILHVEGEENADKFKAI